MMKSKTEMAQDLLALIGQGQLRPPGRELTGGQLATAGRHRREGTRHDTAHEKHASAASAAAEPPSRLAT
jgi:hypothetical protein